MNELEIIKGCAKGDNEARHQLYERYAGLLMTVCVRYVGGQEEARDVLHDTFLQAFRSFNRFEWRGDGSLKAWLVRIAVNLSLAYLRKRIPFAGVGADVEGLPEPVDDDENLKGIPKEVLLKFVSELPPGYRMVFNLYVFEERSHRDIAELLGITEHTSSSQFYRARSLLMKKIGEYMQRKKPMNQKNESYKKLKS